MLGLGAALLLNILKLLNVFKNFLFFFVSVFIYRPGRKLLSIVFHKFVVKFYSLYLKIAKRLGFERSGAKFVNTFNQRFVHFLVAFMTIILLLVNLGAKTKISASAYVDNAHETILAELVKSEFEGFAEADQFSVGKNDFESFVTRFHWVILWF